jgi:hypothetical protein
LLIIHQIHPDEENFKKRKSKTKKYERFGEIIRHFSVEELQQLFDSIDNDEAGYYRHILRTNGVEVLYVSENFNDITDDLVRPVKQWQARQESKDLCLPKITSGQVR